MNNEIFREYDIRGNVERDLTDDTVRSIGRAFGSYMAGQGKKRASICRDCRLSSEHYRDLLVETMVESGLDVTDIGLAPTPLFYYSLFNLDVEGGIMVTGSHNPKEFNGLKLAFGKLTLYGDQIQEIRRIIEADAFATPAARGSLEQAHIGDAYVICSWKRSPWDPAPSRWPWTGATALRDSSWRSSSGAWGAG